MRITNPTNQDIKNIQIGENIYNLNAGETLENVPEADARYWQENLHKFLVLKKDKEVIVEDKIEIPTPKVEIVDNNTIETTKEEEVKEEVIEEKIETPIVKEVSKNKKNK